MSESKSLPADKAEQARPLFDFHMRACEHDREGYYYPRWDQATPITVRAATKQEAVNQAAVALGPARSGRYWAFQVDKIESAPVGGVL